MKLTFQEIQALRANFTASENKHEHFRRCWRHQDCGGCLRENQCSWCPFTSSCVPNSYPVPLLAPAYDENICPYWAERWEIRTRPLGCQVSTITSITSIVSVASTLVVLLLLLLSVYAVRWLRRTIRAHPDSWAPFQRKWWHRVGRKTPETEPLLGESQPNHDTANGTA